MLILHRKITSLLMMHRISMSARLVTYSLFPFLFSKKLTKNFQQNNKLEDMILTKSVLSTLNEVAVKVSCLFGIS